MIYTSSHQTDRGDEAGIRKVGDGRLLIVPDPGWPAALRQQDRNNAVGARRGSVHRTGITVDDQNGSSQ